MCQVYRQCNVAMLLVRWLQGDSSMPRETNGTTALANMDVQKAQEQVQRRKRGSYHHYANETSVKIAKYLCDHGAASPSLGMLLHQFTHCRCSSATHHSAKEVAAKIPRYENIKISSH